MKHLITILTLLNFLNLAACASKNEAQEPTTCTHDIDNYQVLFPDGFVRKSEVTTCVSQSKTCVYSSWVNDPKVNFVKCQ